MSQFTVTQPLANVFHIQDAGKVCFTLIRGKQDTLLWDTGMGFYNVAQCIAPYRRGRLHVVLSHGHYDHVCGQHYFDNSYIHADDLTLAAKSVSRQSKTAAMERLGAYGIVPETFSVEQYMRSTPDTIHPLRKMTLSLGHLDVQFLHTPGHTQGSLVAYIPALKLILTADIWNPTTWLFFPESQSLALYKESMEALLSLTVEHVLCSHDPSLFPAQRLHAYIKGLNAHTFTAAAPCSIAPYTHIRTFSCHPDPLSTLIFNGDKRR